MASDCKVPSAWINTERENFAWCSWAASDQHWSETEKMWNKKKEIEGLEKRSSLRPKAFQINGRAERCSLGGVFLVLVGS